MSAPVSGVFRRFAENLIFWLIAVTALITAILGGWAWWDRLGDMAFDRRLAETVFRTLRAFTFGDVYDDPAAWDWDWRLRLTRWLGMVTTIGAILRVVFAFIAYQVKKFRAWFWRDHAVVIGDDPAARRFAELWSRDREVGWDGRSRRVIHHASIVENDLDGVLTIERPHTLTDRLAQDSLRGAKRVLVAETTDSLTADTALSLTREHPETHIFAFVEQSWLAARLNQIGGRDAEVTTNRMTVLSKSLAAASAVMRRYPPYLLARRSGCACQHIVIVSYGGLGEALIAAFLSAALTGGPDPLIVTIIDRDAARARTRFEGRYPMLACSDMLDIAFIEADGEYLIGPALDTLRERCAAARPCAAYVAISETGAPLAAAAALRETADRYDLFSGPIFVRSTERTVLSAFIEPLDMAADRRLIRFGEWRDIFAVCGMFDEEPDLRAKRFHDEYLRFKTHQIADKPWAELEERFRIANRNAVAHIPAKLHSVGFDLEAWSPRIPMSPNALPKLRTGEKLYRNATEMVALARLEHSRWVADRTLDGWMLGPERVDATKTHDLLIPFDKLPDAELRKDLAYVALLGEWLEESETGLPRIAAHAEPPVERAADRALVARVLGGPNGGEKV